mmetsp:Transcript_50918/g.110586  ORF Transcript_50918/g.110586 Transcript_50918/m.110586 type:complete len:252 (-) Transcript_50918:350-1105(-)
MGGPGASAPPPAPPTQDLFAVDAPQGDGFGFGAPPAAPPAAPSGLGGLVGFSLWPSFVQRMILAVDVAPPAALHSTPRVEELWAWTQPLTLPLLLFTLVLLVCVCRAACCCGRKLARRCARAKGLAGSAYQFNQYSVTITPDLRSANTAASLDRLDGFSDGSDAPEPELSVGAVKAGAASKVCTYEEINETNFSDCSAESADFESFENGNARDGYGSGKSSKSNGHRFATRRAAPGTEKSSLLNEMDVLVT